MEVSSKSTRVEDIQGVSSVFRETQPIDMTGFRLRLDQYDFQQLEYDTISRRFIEFDIQASDDYLQDLACWFKVTRITDAGGAEAGDVDKILSETANLIQTVEIRADGEQILYLDYARHYLSIMQQKKHDASDFLHHKLKSVEHVVDYGALINPGAAVTTANRRSNKVTSREEIHLERNRTAGSHGMTVDGAVTDNHRYCIFRLSDLGLFNAFPLMFLKRGI